MLTIRNKEITENHIANAYTAFNGSQRRFIVNDINVTMSELMKAAIDGFNDTKRQTDISFDTLVNKLFIKIDELNHSSLKELQQKSFLIRFFHALRKAFGAKDYSKNFYIAHNFLKNQKAPRLEKKEVLETKGSPITDYKNDFFSNCVHVVLENTKNDFTNLFKDIKLDQTLNGKSFIISDSSSYNFRLFTLKKMKAKQVFVAHWNAISGRYSINGKSYTNFEEIKKEYSFVLADRDELEVIFSKMSSSFIIVQGQPLSDEKSIADKSQETITSSSISQNTPTFFLQYPYIANDKEYDWFSKESTWKKISLPDSFKKNEIVGKYFFVQRKDKSIEIHAFKKKGVLHKKPFVLKFDSQKEQYFLPYDKDFFGRKYFDNIEQALTFLKKDNPKYFTNPLTKNELTAFLEKNSDKDFHLS